MADRFADVVNVLDFGVDPTGVADSTAAVQAAIDAATDGGAVYFPAGTYGLTDALNVTTAGLRLYGPGAKLVQGGTLKNGIVISAARVTVEGLWIYGSRGGADWNPVALTNSSGVRLNAGADNARIVGNRIENWSCDGVRWGGAAAEVEVSGNTIIGIGSAGGITSGDNYNFGVSAYTEGSNCGGCKIIGNTIRDTAQGIFVGNDWHDLLVANNTITDIQGQHGIYWDNTTNLSCHGNVIRDVAQIGIKLQIASNATMDCENASIVGNVIDSPGQIGIAVIPSEAGLSYFFHGVSIVGNSIIDAGSEGIRIDQADGWVISGNSVRGCVTFGIRSDVRNRSGRISGNSIFNTAQTAIHCALASSAYVAIIEDNLIVEPATAGGATADLDSAMYLTTGEHIVRGNVVKSASTPYTNNVTSHAVSVVSLYENRFPSGKSNSIGGTINTAFAGSVSADRGDASVTIQAGVDAETQLFATTLTANRTVTLSTTSATKGDRFRVVRTGLGAYTLAVGALKTIPNSTAAFVDIQFNGAAWILVGYGAL